MERTVSVRLQAIVSGWVSPVKHATQSVRDLRSELSKAATSGGLDRIEQQATRLGLALSGGFLLAIGTAAKFEKQMSEVGSVVDANADQLDALSKAALQAGADTVFSASEAAKAEAELGKAGLTTGDILGGALTGALSLAAAGSLDLAEAADVAAKTMNIFDLQGRDVSHIADVLAASANKSATDVHELGFAMKMGGLAAKNAGVSLEETVGTFSAFADNALAGSDAGTSFKTMLQMLAAPTDKARGLMEELGINVYDAQGNFVGIAALAGILRDKLGKLTQEQRNQALATIFGADAMRAATVLINEGEQGIREYTQAVNDQGAAERAAAAKTDNLMGDIERLTGSLETLFITSGQGANGGLRILVQGVESLVDGISALPQPVLSAGTIIIGLAGAGLLAFSALVKVRKTTREIAEELRKAGPATMRFATGLQNTVRWATKAGAALGLMAAVAQGLQAVTDTETDMQGLDDAIKHLGETGEYSGELMRLFEDDLDNMKEAGNLASSGANGVLRFLEAIVPLQEQVHSIGGLSATEATQAFRDIDNSLATLVRSGNIEAARKAYLILMQQMHLTADEMEALTPVFNNALGEAERTTGKQEAAAKAATEQNIKLAGAFGKAASEANGLKDAFDRLNGVELNYRDAMRKVEQGLDDLRDALKASGGSMDIHTEKGRNAQEALDNYMEAAAAATQATYDQTGSVEDAQATWDHYIEQLRILLRAAGYSKDEIEALIEKIGRMPPSKTVNIKVKSDVDKAIEKVHRLKLDMDKLKNKHVKITADVFVTSEGVHVPGGVILRREGGITMHAQQGLLREPAIFSPQAPARFAFAEPETGGEAFVPRRGDHNRALGILSTAAAWHGAQVVPTTAGGSMPGLVGAGGGGGTMRVLVEVAGGGDQFTDAIADNLRVRIDYAGGTEAYFSRGRRGR